MQFGNTGNLLLTLVHVVVMATEKNTIRTLLFNHKEPLVFKQFLNWEILQWNLQHWNKVLGERKLKFRGGNFAHTKEPQWERTCEPASLSFADFLGFEARNPTRWIYFDYKYLHEHLTDVKSLQDAISWSEFGFPDLKADDSTIWIGTKGAHTPCHVDTYGCNLIAQVYGRKRWILFPPNENLLPTRVPYEESSIYSKFNLFSPCVEKFKGISKAMSVVLNPGEVLFLPHGWWHYVESLETTISVNVWIPLYLQPVDDEKRLEESLIQLVVSQFVRNLDEAIRGRILNPNPENQQLHERNVLDAMKLVQSCKNTCKKNPHKKLKTGRDSVGTSEDKFEDILHADNRIFAVPYLLQEEFHLLLHSQRSRFLEVDGNSVEKDSETLHEIIDVINAFTDVNVIGIVKENILKGSSI